MKAMEQQQGLGLGVDSRAGKNQQGSGLGPGLSPDARYNLHSHPGLRSVVFEAMNPLHDWDMDTTDARGNWGLWNFEGQGPEGGSVGVTHSERPFSNRESNPNPSITQPQHYN